jgi:hypothetical protein
MKKLLFFFCMLWIEIGLFAQNKLTEYEYWFDNDYSAKITSQITPTTTYQWQTTIPCEQLSVGIHTFNTRFKDQTGKFTTTVSRWFQKLPETNPENKIVLCEYWTDNNYLQRVSLNIAPSSKYALKTAIDFDALPEGLHIFNTRFKDSMGKWSTTVSQYFQKLNPIVPNKLIAYEYWFNDSYDKKYSGTINGEQSFIILDEIDTQTAMSTSNAIHFRFKDNKGLWSSVLTSEFSPPSSIVGITVEGLRIYPNPVKDILYIESPSVIIIAINIVNSSGETVYRSADKTHERKIDLKNYSNGVYILSIETEKGIVSHKILVD